jgi:hypothetical protein
MGTIEECFFFGTVKGPRRPEGIHRSRGEYKLQKQPCNNAALGKAQPTDKAISFTKNTLEHKDEKQSGP